MQQQGDKSAELPDAAQSHGAKGTGKKDLCRGCSDNFYNLPGNSTTGECWSLATAKVVERTQVGIWQNPPYDWHPQKTLSCHRPEGAAWINRDDVRLRENGAAKASRIGGAAMSEHLTDADVKTLLSFAERLRAQAEQRDAALHNEARTLLAKLDTLEHGIASLRSQRDELLAIARHVADHFVQSSPLVAAARAAIAKADAGGEGRTP